MTHRTIYFWILALAGFVFSSYGYAATFTVNVVDQDGMPVPGFRWLVEEDTTLPVTPGVRDLNSLSLSFHSSHTPTVMQGETAAASATTDIPDIVPAKRYYISVLPYSGHQMSGAPLAFPATGAGNVTVVVNRHAIPTAQISVFVFEDNHPINNIPDLPAERGIDGVVNPFSVLLFDAAGQYGVAGGQVLKDAFNNPLGTEYDPVTHAVTTLGTGIIRLNSSGVALIKNLAPAKYGIQVVPPAGQDWHQTSTIEGTKTVDAWVKANEPQYFVEFGPPGPHVFIGFVKTTTTLLQGSATISGKLVNIHASRPPDYTFYNGDPVPNCWVGLNSLVTGTGAGVYAQRCNADSTFNIPNVPPGNYQLVVWDDYLDVVFAFLGVTIDVNQTRLDLAEVPVFNWYSRLRSYVFFDANGNGIREPTEAGLPNQNVNLRFRDGRIYQTAATDTQGFVPFDEVFPFFNWLVAEVDFARFKATGATITVDAGGPIDPSDPSSFGGALNPQPQAENGNGPNRTETGPVLTQAFQGFLGQTNVIEWGKGLYAAGENGGISGIIYYATTRAESDPRYAVGEEWEPGIPRIQVSLYLDANQDGVIDDINGMTGIQHADVDNYPFGNFPGLEDVDHNTNGAFNGGDAINVATSDSWDDNKPTGCQGEPFVIDGVTKDCYDGLRNFNQVRPGVFDGGYAFSSYFPGGMDSISSTEVNGLPAGTYIVAAAVPRGYELVKEEDRNVDLGDAYVPSTQALPAVCVGDLHTVPAYMSLLTDASGALLPGNDPVESAAPFAGSVRPLCNQKQVRLANAQNAPADFFMYTKVPKAAHVVGIILNDLANEFDPKSPQFGEKYSPPWVPVSFRDWTGREIKRTYSDEFGAYNAMLPSTYSVNLPMPSGVSPNMVTACMNDAGAVPNPARASDPTAPPTITDPFFNRQYSQFCYTFQYMPGSTTYLDTPVLPVAAFAGPGQFPVDCERPSGTPLIYSVSGPGGGAYALRGQQITITAAGLIDVPNPAFGAPGQPRTIQRDFGFGARGSVTLAVNPQQGPNQVAPQVPQFPLTIVSWSPNQIVATIPTTGLPTGVLTRQLTVTTGANVSTPVGVTLTIGTPQYSATSVRYVYPSNLPNAHQIQDAIDLAKPTDLILVTPGYYDELPIMYKPVKLQGSGALSTVINARKAPAEKLQYWRTKINCLFDGVVAVPPNGSACPAGAPSLFDILPGQERGFAPGGDFEPTLFFAEEGAGITVVAKRTGPAAFTVGRAARIDGITFTGADHGGGIFVSGYATGLEISNNWIMANQGTFGGGIRIGHPNLLNGSAYTNAANNNIRIHHNHVAQNGNFGGAGGGVSLYTGTLNYAVTNNFICGNFAQTHGAGIGHLGYSNNGLIADNTIIFNQSFNQGTNVSGGGVFVGGAAGLTPNALTPGSGSVTIDGNLIQGNHAAAGDGGGIAADHINGTDVSSSGFARWNNLDILNNMIVNNVAGLAGGGISLQDTAKVRIVNNTVANNDSTSTVSTAFLNNPNESEPQPGAGIVARAHSAGLTSAIAATNASILYKRGFSNPSALRNNILWHNRSFYWSVNNATDPATFGLIPDVGAGAAPVYSDVAVIPATLGYLNPSYSVLTDVTGYPASNFNIAADPLFMDEVLNGDRGQTIIQPEFTTSLTTAPAFDEGGNFIDVRYGPLSLSGNYHLQTTSPGIDRALIFTGVPRLTQDFDNVTRTLPWDIGADEVR